MISKFRTLSDRFFIKICFGIIVCSFLGLGFGELFSQKDYVVSINGKHCISVQDFARTKNILKRNKDVSLSDRDFNIAVLNSMIQDHIIKLEAKRLGATISDVIIAGQIASNPAFRSGSNFDVNLFKKALVENHLTENELLEKLKLRLSGDLLSRIPPPKIEISNELAQALYNYEKEVKYINLYTLASHHNNISVSSEEIEQYYNANKESFKTKELRDIEYMVLEQDKIESRLKISEEEIQKLIKKENEGGADGNTADAELRKIVIKNQQNIYFQNMLQDIEKDLASGDSIKEIASKLGMPYKTVKKVSQSGLKKQLHLQNIDSFISEAFTLDANTPSDPISVGNKILCILSVKNIYPAGYQELSDVREEIKKSIIASKQDNLEQQDISKAYSQMNMAPIKSLPASLMVKTVKISRNEALTSQDIKAQDALKLLSLEATNTLSHVFKTKNNHYAFATLNKATASKHYTQNTPMQNLQHIQNVKVQLSKNMFEITNQEFTSDIYSRYKIRVMDKYLT